MRIIDAHLHFSIGNEHFDTLAKKAGHENSEEHLKLAFKEAGYVGGVVMGYGGLDPRRIPYPSFLHYCIGVNTAFLQEAQSLAVIEQNLMHPRCAGIKLYPGYDPTYIYDPAYFPVYELARNYKKPVAIHTGLTGRSNAFLKYCHPLTVDDAAVLYPDVQFVISHFGNPWLADACAVATKNKNVAIDLSGLLEGRLNVPAFMREQEGFVTQLRTWLQYLERYEDILFGTDWPLVNLQEYAEFVQRIIPERHQEAVFFDNANRIYQMGI